MFDGSTGIRLLGAATLLWMAQAAWSDEAPRIAGAGAVIRHEAFPSQLVAPRRVDVWLPPGYSQDAAARYPVIYMHDGENLFDAADAKFGVEWGIDEVMTEPKPFIDSQYRTLRGRDDTFVMGSSMGGLISAYAISEYPEVFGRAACVSTHWPAGQGAVAEYLATRLPDPATHRIYFDFGTATLDAGYEHYQRRMDESMRRAGYIEGRNWVTLKFDGAEHNETAWRRRLPVILGFLLAG